MGLNVILTPGFNWPAGTKVTRENLRQAAKPSIRIEGSVGGSDIADNSIGAVKLRSESWFWATGDAGTDTIELSLANPAGSLVDGLTIRFLAASSKTSAATINLDGTGAHALCKQNGSALALSDIQPGQVVGVVYVGSASNGEGAWCMISQIQTDAVGDIIAAVSVNGNIYDLTIGVAYLLQQGFTVRFKIPVGGANQAAPTIRLNGGTEYPMIRADGKPFLGGELDVGMLVTAVFDGSTSWFVAPWLTSDIGWNESSTDQFAVAIAGVTSLVNGLHLRFNPKVANSSGNCTLNVNGLGAKQIVRWNGETLLPLELHSRYWYQVTLQNNIWYLNPIHVRFRSKNTIPPEAGGEIHTNHELNRTPDFFNWYYILMGTQDWGYVNGDSVPLDDMSAYGDGLPVPIGRKYYTMWANAVEVGLTRSGHLQVYVVPKLGGAYGVITSDRWNVYAVCTLIL